MSIKVLLLVKSHPILAPLILVIPLFVIISNSLKYYHQTGLSNLVHMSRRASI